LQMYEVLLGGYATAGDEKKVTELCAEASARSLRLSARALSLIIKGYLKNSMIEGVISKFQDMQSMNFQIPPFAVTQLFRIAGEASSLKQAFDKMTELGIPMNSDAYSIALEDCCKKENLEFAKRIEQNALDSGVPFSGHAYDSLLKLYTMAGDVRALILFKEMHDLGHRISDGLCVGLLARCAGSKFLRFAEEIIRYARARGSMSISVYSAFMKVYAFCGMYGKACDLYDAILKDGLEPDTMMYGCLMRFAVECGRTDMSRRIAEKSPHLEMQNYMSLIRAAGRDRDVDRAFDVLRRLQEASVEVDAAAYNCVLDVCVSVGEIDRARALLEQMRVAGSLGVITYNTFLKGFCQAGNLTAAKALLQEMVREGFKPNDVSYNCLLNAAVRARTGNLSDAWDVIDMMDQSNVTVDSYTISTMMKGVRNIKDRKDIQRALALLDRSGIDVCKDEILLTTVLDTCIRHEHKRLEGIIESVKKSSIQPSVHTYGALIKACSILKWLPECLNFWRHIEERGLQPTHIVLGCMLDALVCNQEVEKAIDLLEQWRDRVPPNAIMYSTLIKGFSNTHQNERAMAMWREMCKNGTEMNAVVYNAVIDAQARVGAMSNISELIGRMEVDGVTPDAISCSTMVKGYCIAGDMDKAVNLFQTMHSSEMVKDAVAYNTILDGCIRYARWDVADKMMQYMEKGTVAPTNFTLGIIVKMYGRRRQVDEAFQQVDKMCQRHGLVVNAQVRTFLASACVNNNALDRALGLLDEAKSAPGGVDPKLYSTLIFGCIRSKQVRKAVELVEEAYGLTGKRILPSSQSLDPETLEKLFAAISHSELTDKVGLHLAERLRATGVTLKTSLWTSLLASSSPTTSLKMQRNR